MVCIKSIPSQLSPVILDANETALLNNEKNPLIVLIIPFTPDSNSEITPLTKDCAPPFILFQIPSKTSLIAVETVKNASFKGVMNFWSNHPYATDQIA